ncbi:MAG TPA: sodium/solute symporter [Vicinamibacterales bacterium]|nr:sodium/solute symporter [Acidobacteriota bacterium]HOC18411.1 sodium/solute symporter [Vicinamibacterales bacterium]
MLKSVTAVDYAVIAAYLLAMLAIGASFMRFNKGASDYFRGGSRIPWFVAGLSSFMSGFSAWTFTGAAGVAYQQGLVVVLLYVGNGLSFLLGYWLFASRWRRARISTTMEYLTERFDERTRQTFSWTAVIFHLFTGASVLFGLGVFVSSTCGVPIGWTILACGAIILVYCVVGGLWAVVVTDFLQAVILLPFTLVLCAVSLSRIGGVKAFLEGLPAPMTSLALPNEFGWGYVAAWTVMVSFGYNTSVMAQRYFAVDDERSARKVSLLCCGLFLLGSLLWFVPPLAVRVLYPDIAALLPGRANPHEASYAVATLALLPNGLIGVMLAAMFSSTMSNLSGTFHLHAAIIVRDIYLWIFPRRDGERHLLAVGWVATFFVGASIIALAFVMAESGRSVFSVMLTVNTIMSLAYGPPALLGLLISRTPRWSGLASFLVGLALGCVGTFGFGWGLIANVVGVLPASIAVFLLSIPFERRDAAGAAGRRRLAERLATPVDVARELGASEDRTTEVFRFLSRATAGVGLVSLLLMAWAAPGERGTVVLYSGITLLVAVLLALVKGAPAPARAERT